MHVYLCYDDGCRLVAVYDDAVTARWYHGDNVRRRSVDASQHAPRTVYVVRGIPPCGTYEDTVCTDVYTAHFVATMYDVVDRVVGMPLNVHVDECDVEYDDDQMTTDDER